MSDKKFEVSWQLLSSYTATLTADELLELLGVEADALPEGWSAKEAIAAYDEDGNVSVHDTLGEHESEDNYDGLVCERSDVRIDGRRVQS